VQGTDGRSFFAVAESENGIDGFRFWDLPVSLPEAPGEVDVGDLRLTRHEDGWIYGVFPSLRGETLSQDASTGIARTRDLVVWERLPDVALPGSCAEALHAGLVRGRYAFYTRRGGAQALAGGPPPQGAGFALCETVEQVEVAEERSLAAGSTPSALELALTVGPPPLKTDRGWLHLGRSGLASGLQAFLCDPAEPWRVTDMPAGRLLVTEGRVSCSGAVLRRNGELLVYYTQATGIHVATTTVDRLLDFVIRSPEPVPDVAASLAQRAALVDRNLKLLARSKGKAYRGLRSWAKGPGPDRTSR
jgi:4-O-beta-D-mannosyl-D-glucose phosphorylase